MGRYCGRERSSWFVGIVLIAVGLIFLLRNTVWGFALDNWWALFILIPAAGSFGTAWNLYRKNNGRMTQAAIGPLMGGLFGLFVAGVFLFNLNWGRIWPVFLILAGLGALGKAMVRQDEDREDKSQSA